MIRLNQARAHSSKSTPVEGGSANDYDYSLGDPCNNYDLDGRRARVSGKGKLPCAIGAGINVAWGARKIGKGVAIIQVGTVAIPFTSGISGPVAYAWGGAKIGGGLYKSQKGFRHGWMVGTRRDCTARDIMNMVVPAKVIGWVASVV